ncbi:MAG: DUF6691 family protein [Rhodospirillales bacterium]
MARNLVALLAGLVFGLGLAVSRLVDPGKVLAFLDVAGRWDPSLALVMASALGVTLIGYRLVLRRPAPLLAESFGLPTRRDIDARLVGGAALFGVGWGLVGFCPGPALASLAYGRLSSVLFVAAMLLGMALYRVTAMPRA